MTDRPAQLRFARRSYAVAWRDFIHQVAADASLLCCFFEGEDLKFYGIRIDLIVQPSRFRAFSVGGRTGVLQILDLVTTAESGRYASHPVAFFVDRDFIPPQVTHAWLYVTPDYSVENLYVSPQAFERVLAAELGINKDEANHAAVASLYVATLNAFNVATRPLNGWLRQQRLLESQRQAAGDMVSSLNLRDVTVWDFVELAIPSCYAKYTLASLDRRFDRTTSTIGEELINAWIGDVANSEPLKAHRGKFLMQFFCKFLARLVEDMNKVAPVLVPERKKTRLNVQFGNALSQFSQYADTPSCLRDFLERLQASLATARETG